MILIRILVIKLFILKSHALSDKLILALERSDFNNIENTVYSELNNNNFNYKHYKNASDVQSESSKHLGNQILIYNNKDDNIQHKKNRAKDSPFLFPTNGLRYWPMNDFNVSNLN